MQEEWRPIPSAAGYEASSLGRIKGPRCILKPTRLNSGYMGVKIAKRGTTVHAAVARAFTGPPPTERHTVNHKNGIKTDNRPENLEWLTQAENNRHAVEVLGRQNGRKPKPRDPADEMPPLPDLRMRITVERFDAGPPSRHTFELLRSKRIDTYRVIVDGQPWAVCGLSRVLEGLRKATPRLLSARAMG